MSKFSHLCDDESEGLFSYWAEKVPAIFLAFGNELPAIGKNADTFFIVSAEAKGLEPAGFKGGPFYI